MCPCSWAHLLKIVVFVVLVALAVAIFVRSQAAGMDVSAWPHKSEHYADYGYYRSGDDGLIGGGEGYDGGGPFRLKMSDPLFARTRDGAKTVEVRLDARPFSDIKEKDKIVVVRARPQGETTEFPGGYKFDAEVTAIKRYPNFAAFYKHDKCAAYPGMSEEEAKATFTKYIPKEKVDDPVIAFTLKVSGAAKAHKAKP